MKFFRAAPPLRLVLDTNVWLDWLVFDDVWVRPIRAMAQSGSARIFIDAACGNELVNVLARPQRGVVPTPETQTQWLTECQAAVTQSEEAALSRCDLPRCSDPDDQKFLELARNRGADYLLTRDRALLILARRRQRPVPFRIVTPREFYSISLTDCPR